MALLSFILLVIIFLSLVNREGHNDISDETHQNNCRNTCYTQNNHQTKSKKKKKNSNYFVANKNYRIKYSKSALAKKLLENYDSKRTAKDILVKQYGVSEKEAKFLVRRYN